jgi:hypothetical protein
LRGTASATGSTALVIVNVPTAHAVVLDLDQRELDANARHRRAAGRHGDNGGVQPVFLRHKQGRPPETDVPGRRVDDCAGTAGDVLA